MLESRGEGEWRVEAPQASIDRKQPGHGPVAWAVPAMHLDGAVVKDGAVAEDGATTGGIFMAVPALRFMGPVA